MLAPLQVTDTRSYTWLKWVAAAVLFVEAFVGVALPLPHAHHGVQPNGTCRSPMPFAGGAFFTFGAPLNFVSSSTDPTSASCQNREPY